MPADLESAYAILDAGTGSRDATMAMLSDSRWPGAELAAPDFRAPVAALQVAQAGAGTVPLPSITRIAQPGAETIPLPSIGDITVERLPTGALRIGGVIFTAAILLHELERMGARSDVLAVMARFGLDQSKAADVLAARAYVWADTRAPIPFPNMPWSGPVHERTCEAIMRYELEHPGTAGLATRGHPNAVAAISVVVDQAAGVVETPVLERTSSVDPALSTSSTRARAILGNPNLQAWQAHHLIPFGVVAALLVSVQQTIVASGWVMDSAENLIALPANLAAFLAAGQSLPIHSGSHPRYDTEVMIALAPTVVGAQRIGTAALRAGLLAVENLQRTRLFQGRYHIRVH
jgi:hypothetical protein